MKTYFAIAGILLSLLAGNTFAQTDSWPSRPVKIITPTAPGSATDYFARAMAQQVQDETKHGAFVDNRPGGNTMIGTEAAKNSAPDGYTFFVGSLSTHSLNPVIMPKLSYDPAKDFVEVGMFSTFGYLMVVHKNSPIQSVSDLIAAAKARPGKVSCGYSSAASRVPCELLKAKEGLDIIAVAYKAVPAILNDVIAGTIDFTLVDVMSATSIVKGGVLRPIAITTGARSPIYPEVKTLAETLPGFVFEGWAGLTAPAGTPKPVIERMNQYLKTALAEGGKLRSYIEDNGGSILINSPAEQAEWVAADRNRWREWVKLANIQP